MTLAFAQLEKQIVFVMNRNNDRIFAYTPKRFIALAGDGSRILYVLDRILLKDHATPVGDSYVVENFLYDTVMNTISTYILTTSNIADFL